MCILPRLSLLALACFSGAATADIAGLTIIPAQPRYMEPVYARIQKPASNLFPSWYAPTVTMSNNGVQVTLQWVDELGDPYLDVFLGRFPSGTYTVNANEAGRSTTASGASFTVGSAPASGPYPGNSPSINATDLWWNPAEPGWGMSITQGPGNKLFLAWYTYDVTGQPTFFTLQPGQWNSRYEYEGPIYKTTGSAFSAPYGSPPLGVTAVGTGTIVFADWNTAGIDFTINGVRISKQIKRQPIE